jgi:hypothetical protein
VTVIGLLSGAAKELCVGAGRHVVLDGYTVAVERDTARVVVGRGGSRVLVRAAEADVAQTRYLLAGEWHLSRAVGGSVVGDKHCCVGWRSGARTAMARMQGGAGGTVIFAKGE